ncbi:MAG TPA: hypothetical protein O0X39_04060 [Methanocorpusculum sp.]|nr:hypothetical protein [Methanocorpusculum sp.]
MKRAFCIVLIPLCAVTLASGIVGIIFSDTTASFICSAAAVACSAPALAFSIVLLCLLRKD